MEISGRGWQLIKPPQGELQLALCLTVLYCRLSEANTYDSERSTLKV